MDLSLLGLTTYEQHVYDAVVRHGKSSAATLSKTSGVPYGRIYDTLARLEADGLVKVVPEKTKMYVAADPQKLQEKIDDMKSRLKGLETDVRTLTELYKHSGPQPVQVAQGKANFYRLLKEMPKTQNLDYSIKYSSEYRPDWARDKKRHLQTGVDTRTLARIDEETAKDIEKWKKVDPHIRSFDNQGCALSIRDGCVLIALIKNNTTVLIRDEAFTDIMQRLFRAAHSKA